MNIPMRTAVWLSLLAVLPLPQAGRFGPPRMLPDRPPVGQHLSSGWAATGEAPPARSDSNWLESDVIAEALKANPGLAAAQARVDVMRARALRAGAWPAPTVAFEFFNTPITSLNPLHDGLENDYSVQQMIPLSGMPGLMREMAEAQTRMERSSLVVRASELVRDLRADIAMLMGARAQLRINAENHALIEQILRSAEAAYGVGRSRQADVLRVRVERERSTDQCLSLEADIARSEAMINARLNRPADARIPDIIMQSLESLDVPPVTAAVPIPDEARSELHMMEAEAEMARAQETLAGRAWVPELMLRAMYKEMTMGMPDSWALMIGISVPFAPWSQPAVRGAREEAAALRLDVVSRTEEMRAMIAMQRREARSKAAALRARLDRYAKDLLPASAQAVAAAQASYGSGNGDFVTLLDAARMHVMLRMEAAMLEAEFRAAHAAMQWAEGEQDQRGNP